MNKFNLEERNLEAKAAFRINEILKPVEHLSNCEHLSRSAFRYKCMVELLWMIEVIDKSDCVLMEMNYSPSKLMFYLFDGCLILHVMVDSGSWLTLLCHPR